MKASLFPSITRWWLVCMLAVVGLVLGLSVPAALAVHDLGLFELEGNAVDDTFVAGDDWNQIYCDHIDPDRTGACGPSGLNVAPSTALVGVFLTDPVESPSDDIFDGAKDSLDIKAGAPQDWHWKVAEPNDKNDIEHAYAAIYQAANNDFILYFGMDKLSNNGDAAIGFWFLQNDVTQLGTAARANPFSAGHVPGDILVQADITSGGDVGRSDTYTWVAGTNQTQINANCTALGGVAVAPSQGGLCRLTGADTTRPTGGTCGDSANDDSCAIMNTQDETAPWPYKFKFSGGVADSTVFPVATFFEAGLNLSVLFPGGIPCISTFLAETRQSQSETAELEDKLIGSFDLCSISVTKSGPEKSKVGDTASYTIVITNNGALPLNKVSIIDDKLGDLTGYCGATLNAGESCTINVSKVLPAGSLYKNTVTATYLRDTSTIDTTVVGTAWHEVILINPSITFDKKAEGSDGPLTVLQGATVDYTLTLNNTSPAGTPTLNCTITDTQLGVSQSATLTSGQSTTVNASKTFTTAPQTFINTANVSCTPEGFTNTLTASDSVTVNVTPSTDAITVDKTGDGYSKVGDSVNYTITITNISAIDLTLTDVTDTKLGDLLDSANAYRTGGTCTDDLVLAPNASCTITASRETQAGDADPFVNVVTATAGDAFGGTANDSDDHSVDIVHPSYTVAKDCLTDPVPQGQSANFRITIVNTGDVNLLIDVTDTVLGINQTDVLLGARSGAPCTVTELDSDASDGCYQIEAGVIATGSEVSNTVDVLATLPTMYGLPNEIKLSATDVCEVEGGATRTWGFWKTHGSDDLLYYGYTCHVFEDHLGSSVNLGWKVLTNCKQVFGLFWADPATDPGKTGTKKKDTSRDLTCKTSLHASQQLLAAILNQALTNGSPIPGTLQADTVAALAACADNNSATPCDRNLLVNLAGQLAAYNESGDEVAIVDADGAMIPHADPRGMREIADYSISSCPAP